MPIDYSKYHPNWKEISRYIRFERASNKCEWCAAPNGQHIYRPEEGSSDWVLWPETEVGQVALLGAFRPVKIVLTVAHIDRDKNNNDYANLAALCQRCHLNHDRHQHANNRKYGRNHKDSQGTLF